MILWTICGCGTLYYRRNDDGKVECFSCHQLVFELEGEAVNE